MHPTRQAVGAAIEYLTAVYDGKIGGIRLEEIMSEGSNWAITLSFWLEEEQSDEVPGPYSQVLEAAGGFFGRTRNRLMKIVLVHKHTLEAVGMKIRPEERTRRGA